MTDKIKTSPNMDQLEKRVSEAIHKYKLAEETALKLKIKLLDAEFDYMIAGIIHKFETFKAELH